MDIYTRVGRALVLAATLLVLWGWFQNGRYRFASGDRYRHPLVLDTRTGYVYYSTGLRVGESETPKKP